MTKTQAFYLFGAVCAVIIVIAWIADATGYGLSAVEKTWYPIALGTCIGIPALVYFLYDKPKGRI